MTSTARPKRMRRLVLAGCTVVLLLMAACGGGSGSGLASLMSDAVNKTGSSSARVVMDMNISSPSAAEAGVQLTTSGDVGEHGRSADLTMQVAESSKTRTIDMRLVDDTMYLRVPGQDVWQRFDASQLSGDFGASDPTSGLEFLLGAADSITEQGSEDVRGVPTTRYHAVIDLAKSAARLGGEARQRVEGLSQLGLTNLPTDVWIDDQGRVRREFFTMHVAQGGQEVTIAMTMELFDFGVPVDVQAPPDDQVREGDPASLGLPG